MTIEKLAAIPAGRRVCLDTKIWIDAFEGFAPCASGITALFERVDAGELTVVTSE